MLRGRTQPGALPSEVQRLDTEVLRISLAFLAATALVQLA